MTRYVTHLARYIGRRQAQGWRFRPLPRHGARFSALVLVEGLEVRWDLPEWADPDRRESGRVAVAALEEAIGRARTRARAARRLSAVALAESSPAPETSG